MPTDSPNLIVKLTAGAESIETKLIGWDGATLDAAHRGRLHAALDEALTIVNRRAKRLRRERTR
jgi:hypothetical protein